MKLLFVISQVHHAGEVLAQADGIEDREGPPVLAERLRAIAK